MHVTMVHLSAFNTPQFDWGRTCMKGAPRPLGKIFQPEIAAEAIYSAAQKPQREVWVGFPAVQAIVGTRLIPGMLDRWLAHKAYAGQQAGRPLPTDYRDNLYRPVPGHYDAHGRFDARARSFSLQHWLNGRGASAAAVTLAVLLVMGTWLSNRKR